MTANQINYWKLQEDKRSNAAKEWETHRSNTTNEELTRRRDENTLYLGEANLAESKRHNLVGEQETNRSNLAREYETQRANLAREYETSRTNLANEALKRRGQDQSYDLGLRNVSLGYSQLAETKRSNLEHEDYNRKYLSELNRSALAREAEQNRHNTRDEELRQGTLEEQHRANVADETISRYRTIWQNSLDQARTENARKQNAVLEKQADYYGSQSFASSVKGVKDLIGIFTGLGAALAAAGG